MKRSIVTGGLTRTRLRPLVQAIDDREDELRTRIAEERIRTDVEGYSQLTDAVGDEADHAFIRARIDIETSLMERQFSELHELAAARERLAAGTFGRCVECGADIEYERLRMNPAAQRCSECQRLWEDPGARGDIGFLRRVR